MLKIRSVDKKSIAEELGFEPGDAIETVNGYAVSDFIDLIYIDGESELSLGVLAKSGERLTLDIEKEEGEPLGIEIEEEEKIRSCKNKCVFCFIDQLPKGMRESLYVKDDDWRYSLLCGNYVTLTNVTSEDIDRICRYGISPLYISVHASDPEVRKGLVKNPNTSKLFDHLKRLTEEGIRIHTQIVMCKGINDGEVLKETLEALQGLGSVLSVAVVPVGLTGHREGLYPLEPVDKESASRAIDIAEEFKSRGLSVWCSDEMYLKAERDIPPYEYYEDFPQYENGVGMIAELRHGIEENLSLAIGKSGEYGLVTGVSASEEIKRASEALMKKSPELKLEVYPIENRFFGKSITVAGLVTGGDIINALKGRNIPKNLIIPSVMLKEFENVFLDGVSTQNIEKELACRVIVAKADGEGLVRAID